MYSLKVCYPDLKKHCLVGQNTANFRYPLCIIFPACLHSQLGQVGQGFPALYSCGIRSPASKVKPLSESITSEVSRAMDGISESILGCRSFARNMFSCKALPHADDTKHVNIFSCSIAGAAARQLYIHLVA